MGFLKTTWAVTVAIGAGLLVGLCWMANPLCGWMVADAFEDD